MGSIRRTVILGLAVVFAAAAPASAQKTQAHISGTVVDGNGKPIAGATITITTPEITDYKKVVTCTEDGTYRVLIVDATRHYIFHAEAPGFIPEEQAVKVFPRSSGNVFDFTLKTQQQAMETERRKILEEPGYKEVEAARKLLEAGDRAAALAKFREATQARPDLVSAWMGVAELTLETGDFKAARTAADTCLDLDNEQVRCLAVAANASKELGDAEAQKRYLARYQELNPDDPAAFFNEAAQFLNKMDDEHARPLLEKCLKADPDFPKCLYEYGMMLLRSGDSAGAKKKLQHYLEVAPSGPDAQTVTETLKYL